MTDAISVSAVGTGSQYIVTEQVHSASQWPRISFTRYRFATYNIRVEIPAPSAERGIERIRTVPRTYDNRTIIVPLLL